MEITQEHRENYKKALSWLVHYFYSTKGIPVDIFMEEYWKLPAEGRTRLFLKYASKYKKLCKS